MATPKRKPSRVSPAKRRTTSVVPGSQTRKPIKPKTASRGKYLCNSCLRAMSGTTQHCVFNGHQDKNDHRHCQCKCLTGTQATCYVKGCRSYIKRFGWWGYFCNSHYAVLMHNVEMSYPWTADFLQWHKQDKVKIVPIKPPPTKAEKEIKALEEQQEIIKTWKKTLETIEGA